ncbi:hypothetical protein LCGC14_1783170 [marine sediment metagenome]|uniref:Uncharacterized protein n=1 Tax=marine sediment metagenome TaxID=412755 RepID=A0A0F9GUP8_9ZZZZ
MEEKSKDTIMTIAWTLIILGLAALFIYIIGKSLGIIHLPVWVTYIPHMGGGATLLGIALQTGRVLQKIKNVEEDVKDINKDIDNVDNKVGILVTDVVAIKTEVNAHETSIKTMDERVHEISKRG